MPTLDWIGKDKIINHHKTIPYCTLERKYSYDKDGQHEEDNGSENMIIHGDNLYALKALLPQYEGKIKCIYIDPPYNTGNKDWCYNDNVDHPLFKKWLEETLNQKESERYVHADDLSRHDKWLCMMYPRLVLLQKLLSEDGAIFISIDDNEQANLKLICDEIFGSTNFIAQIVWKRKRGRDNSARWFSKSHEYLICYAKYKDLFKVNYLDLDESTLNAYKNPDNDPRGPYRVLGCWARGTQGGVKYEFTTKDGQFFSERLWLMSKKNLTDLDQQDKLIIHGDKVYRKMFLYENKGKVPETLWDDTSNAANASDEIKNMFGSIVFDTSKPTPYIAQVLKIATNPGDIVLDCFAGSGTTAHALLTLNRSATPDRHFIMVEMMDYANDVTAERIKRVISGYGDVEAIDSSFSFYELGPRFKVDNSLNQNIDIESIKQFIMYSETKHSYVKSESPNPSFIGRFGDTAYYLLFGSEMPNILDNSFISVLESGCSSHVVYADACYIPDDVLDRHNIRFKKIPRDIRGC